MLVLVILVVFLIAGNKIDKKKFEKELKSDYPKPGVHDADTDENERI